MNEVHAQYNDNVLLKDEEIYRQLLANGVDSMLAGHIAHLFIRDPLILVQSNIELDIDEELKMDYFENKFDSGFIFNNPNATGHCGCGKSFRTN